MIGLSHYLIFAALLFGIGLFGVLSKRNAIAVLMSVELMLNAVNINFVAAEKYVTPNTGLGQIYALFIIAVAAAEVAVGLALVISIYRQKKSVNLNDFNLLKW
ncbi:MAG TPA: NADH-quinone oxidoreductase subunit NuoK [Syntrophomonas sp.]|nr:NADH-quinone oxidoreductase subunit NuoK [Syntrophomonas sp.]